MLFYKKIAAIALLWGISIYLNAQKFDNIWVVGQKNDNSISGTITINFNNSNPVLGFNTKDIGFLSTNASICDSIGNVLFCTNGIGVFDKNFDLMENGDSLNLGDFFESFYDVGYNLPQGAFILPLPMNSNFFYIFHQRWSYDNTFGTLISNQYYSIVDISKNGGLGKVIEKNILLKSGDLQVSCAVRHGNGRDWWVLIPDNHQQNYTRFLLNPFGVSNLINQDIGFQQSNDDAASYATNLFSPNGSKFIDYDNGHGISIYDFDRCSGLLSNEKWLPQLFLYEGGGAAISQNNRFLYVNGSRQEWLGSKLFQYDLWADNIEGSKKEVSFEKAYTLASDTMSGFGKMQIAPNGKIYMGRANVLSKSEFYWHVIDQPDLEGTDCNVLKKHEGLNFSHPVWIMPIYPNYRLYDSPDSPCDSLGINGPPPVGVLDVQIDTKKNVAVYPNPASDYIEVVFEQQLGSVYFTLQDAQGRILYENELSKQKTQVNTQQLAKGVYFWKAKFKDGNASNGKVAIIH
jgi:Secretion system C-terminal sorting domain